MGLFGLFGKKKKAKKKTIKKQSVRSQPNVRMDRLTPDGLLPKGWRQANKKFTDSVIAEYKYFSDCYFDSKRKSPKEQYAALKSLVMYMRDIKRVCAKKGECFSYWLGEVFSDIEMNQYTEKLSYIEKNIRELDGQYKMSVTVIDKLPDIIKKNPGILQTDVYKMFPPEYKNIISNELYSMDRSGKITRTKSGRSYTLHLK